MVRKKGISPKVWLWLTYLVFGGVVVVILGTLIVFAYFAKDLPNPAKVVRREGYSTKILDRNGKPLYEVYDDIQRTPVEFSQMPLVLQQATVAIEDKNFYKHGGFDPLSPFRIALNVVRFGRLTGGSSLTQQLVKNVLLTSERTATRKLKEFILAIQIERKFTKQEILQMYMNEAPYGGTAWGVETASETYYGKPVSEVTLPEAAILAGLPQSPSDYSPYTGKSYIGRAQDVLRRMREDGYITREQETKAKEELPNVKISTQSGVLKAPHFVFYVKKILEERYGAKLVEEGGLRVTTSLDMAVQEAAEKAVSEEIAKVKYLNITNGAAVVMDPKTGQILAMVGSRGWSDPDYDGKYNVTTALRQPGSAIKPVTYLAGLRKGYTAATMLMDVKTVFPGGDVEEYVPENYDGKFRGPILVREALGNSLNIPAVKMLALVGIKDMLQTAYDMGIYSLEPTQQFLSRVGLAVTLGGGEVRLLDMVTAYSAFANTGRKVDPISILKVTDKDGKVLESNILTSNAPARQVISPEEAYIISSILSDPQARNITFGPGSQIQIPGRTIAVKTGTTNDKRDNWTIGWTPSVIAGVWVGNNNNTTMKQVASGITGAAPIWNKIMKTALGKTPNEEFATPSGIISMDIDRSSGYPAHDGLPSRKEFFVKGTEPTGSDPIHPMIKVCKGQYRLATPADINSGNYENKEGFYFKESDPFSSSWKTPANKWQEGIDKWLSEQADPKYHPPSEYCNSLSPLWIVIDQPGDKSRVNSNEVTIKLHIEDINKVDKVEFYIDGSLKQTLSDPPWELTINLADGKHHVEIKARDEKGNEGSRLLDFGVNEDF